MNKQQLASKIWESANKMRSKIEANEYKDYILGFIFYKFLSDREVKYLDSQDWDQEYMRRRLREEYDPSWKKEGYSKADHQATVEGIRKAIGYFIGYENLFGTWLSMGSDFNVDNVIIALSAFSRLINPSHKKVFKDIFKTLQTGLSKLGENSNARTKAISDLLHLIKDIPMDGRQDYDVLGFIYEYLISNFAANAGKKAGEFYTPHEVSLLMSEIVAHHLRDRKEIKIYDPTSGSGSLLINIGRSAARYMGGGDRIKYYAQELKENTYNLTRMNLVMRGILPDNIVTRNADTLEEDWPLFEDGDPARTYDPLLVDAVVSNPPYSQSWNPADKQADPRYAPFGTAPKGKADYAFLLHDLYHLKSDGIMTIVLPHGVLFRGGEEGEIRKNLIERNHIDAIIGLPANIFFGTGIPTIIMVLRKARSERKDVLIVDASKGFEKVGKNNFLRASDIKRITDAVTERMTIPGFSRAVSRDEIRQNDYNLNIPRYVDSSEKPQSWDIYASMFGGIPAREIDDLSAYWDAFPGLRRALFTARNPEYADLFVADLKTAVRNHPDVRRFILEFGTAFDGFREVLRERFIRGMLKVQIPREEAAVGAEIFRRLSGIRLVDPYEAYQILDNAWSRIAVDLEIIQTEGFASVRQVDPNMVTKKKNGKEQEVQEGWAGHVIPFDLVQQTMLSEQVAELRSLEERLGEIAAGYEEALDSLPEEEKEKLFVNDDKTAFVWKEVKKAVKGNTVEAAVMEILKKVSEDNTEENRLKKRLKDLSAALHEETKKTIEGLTDKQVYTLLEQKWISPLTEELARLPERVISGFIGKLEKLAAKYATTFEEVETRIHDTEQGLSGMIGQLTGSEFDMEGLAELRKMLGGL